MFGFQGVLPFQDPKKPLIQKKYWEAEKDLVGVYKDGKRPNTSVLWGVIADAGLVWCPSKETKS